MPPGTHGACLTNASAPAPVEPAGLPCRHLGEPGPDKKGPGASPSPPGALEPRRGELSSFRPSDGRGPGSDPGPLCAFKVSMFNVSCNSH